MRTKVECWTDLMPPSPGKTYLEMQFIISGNGINNPKIDGITVNWEGGSVDLKNNDYEYTFAWGRDSSSVNLRCGFIMDKGVNRLSAAVKFRFNGRIILYKEDSISVLMVY